MRLGIKAELMTCNECHEKVLMQKGRKMYLNGRGRVCMRWSKAAEDQAMIVGWSKRYDYLIRVRFDGQKTIKTMAVGFFHNCKTKD